MLIWWLKLIKCASESEIFSFLGSRHLFQILILPICTHLYSIGYTVPILWSEQGSTINKYNDNHNETSPLECQLDLENATDLNLCEKITVTEYVFLVNTDMPEKLKQIFTILF